MSHQLQNKNMYKERRLYISVSFAGIYITTGGYNYIFAPSPAGEEVEK